MTYKSGLFDGLDDKITAGSFRPDRSLSLADLERARQLIRDLPTVRLRVDGHFTGSCRPLCDGCREALGV